MMLRGGWCQARLRVSGRSPLALWTWSPPRTAGFLPLGLSLRNDLRAGCSHDGAASEPASSSLLFRARKGHKAQLAETVSRVLWGSPARRALWAPLEKTEIRYGERRTMLGRAGQGRQVRARGHFKQRAAGNVGGPGTATPCPPGILRVSR